METMRTGPGQKETAPAARPLARRAAALFILLVTALTVPLFGGGGVAQAQTPEVVDLSITGPSDNRVDMAFVGDDYAEDELDTFAADVDRIRNNLFTLSPFREYRGYFNVRRIDLAAGDDKLSAAHARQKAALEHLDPDQHEILMLVNKRGAAGLSWTLSWVDSDDNSRWTGVAFVKSRWGVGLQGLRARNRAFVRVAGRRV